MKYSVAATEPPARALPVATAARWFLNDLAEVSGFTVDRGGREVSDYVMRMPLLTTPDPWFFAGLVALEATKVSDLFTKKEAGALLNEIMLHADKTVGRRGRTISKVNFALIGRLGYGAILMRKKVPDEEIGKIIRVLLGGNKQWKHLLPGVKAHRQLYKSLGMGTPSWWSEYAMAHDASSKKRKKRPDPRVDTGPTAMKLAVAALTDALVVKTPADGAQTDEAQTDEPPADESPADAAQTADVAAGEAPLDLALVANTASAA